ncbi:MAG: MarR family transcriptional regulator [Firmicutes bacterium]|nr:MarR family transcriptional regulator [Bacillota bacterium]
MKGEFSEKINSFLIDIFDNILIFEQRSLSKSNSNLSIGEIHIIEQIGLSGNKKMSDIADATGVTLATMTAAADRLERKGCITRERSEVDRRIVLLSLTRYGRVIFKLHRRFHEQMVNKITDGFDDIEIKVLLSALAKLNDFFGKQNKASLT